MTTPWEHYVPVKMDLSDFEEKIEWIRKNEQDAEEIAQRGLIRSRVMNVDTYRCYIIKLLKEYHKLFNLNESA